MTPWFRDLSLAAMAFALASAAIPEGPASLAAAVCVAWIAAWLAHGRGV